MVSNRVCGCASSRAEQRQVRSSLPVGHSVYKEQNKPGQACKANVCLFSKPCVGNGFRTPSALLGSQRCGMPCGLASCKTRCVTIQAKSCTVSAKFQYLLPPQAVSKRVSRMSSNLLSFARLSSSALLKSAVQPLVGKCFHNSEAFCGRPVSGGLGIAKPFERFE